MTTINGMQFPVFDLDRVVRSTHFSMDLGGVVEVYPSRRVIVRFDAGDTIVRYGPRDFLDFAHTPAFFRVPARSTHNFQFSSGVSFRLMMPKDKPRLLTLGTIPKQTRELPATKSGPRSRRSHSTHHARSSARQLSPVKVVHRRSSALGVDSPLT